MRRIFLSVGLLALVTTACTADGDGTTAALEETADGPNRLVILDDSGAITTVAPDGSDPVTVSTPADGEVFFQPQWSPVGDRIAWGRASDDDASLEIADADGSSRLSVATSSLPFYEFWSPDGSRLVVLYNGSGGVEARHIEDGSGTTTVMGAATPYYFSWEPTSARIVANRSGDTLDVIETDGTPDTIGDGSPFYLAPAWTPAGIYHLDGSNLVRSNTDGTSEPMAAIDHATWFAPNPDGSKVAILAFAADGQPDSLDVVFDPLPKPATGTVEILDTTTGDLDMAVAERSAGFFWSPDGEALAILVAGQGDGELRWLVWRDGQTVTLADFRPEPGFVQGVLPFAPQYALSLRVWSPDSAAIAFAGDVDGERGVWTQPADGGEAQKVADGSWVAWSSG